MGGVYQPHANVASVVDLSSRESSVVGYSCDVIFLKLKEKKRVRNFPFVNFMDIPDQFHIRTLLIVFLSVFNSNNAIRKSK